MRMEMNQNGRFAMEILSRSIRMAGFGTTGLIYGEMGLTGSGDSLPVVISSDAATTNGGDAITVAYMEPLFGDGYRLQHHRSLRHDHHYIQSEPP